MRSSGDDRYELLATPRREFCGNVGLRRRRQNREIRMNWNQLDGSMKDVLGKVQKSEGIVERFVKTSANT
jgi:hypothetical protein